jgi:SWI/SNF-related matrix-associated actin-dependent regulator of chromatin subfamily A3
MRVDPSDISEAAKAPKAPNAPNGTGAAGPDQSKKRKAVNQEPTKSSQLVASSSSRPHLVPPQSQSELEEVIDISEEIDELYCTLTAKIVGIQYYKGISLFLSLLVINAVTYILGLVGAGEEVSLVREPGNRYDR